MTCAGHFPKDWFIFFPISNCALVLLSAVCLQLVVNKSHVTLLVICHLRLNLFCKNSNLQPAGHYHKTEPAAKLCMQMYQMKSDFQLNVGYKTCCATCHQNTACMTQQSVLVVAKSSHSTHDHWSGLPSELTRALAHWWANWAPHLLDAQAERSLVTSVNHKLYGPSRCASGSPGRKDEADEVSYST